VLFFYVWNFMLGEMGETMYSLEDMELCVTCNEDRLREWGTFYCSSNNISMDFVFMQNICSFFICSNYTNKVVRVANSWDAWAFLMGKIQIFQVAFYLLPEQMLICWMS